VAERAATRDRPRRAAAASGGAGGSGATGGPPLSELGSTFAQAYCSVITKCAGSLAPIYDAFLPESCATFFQSSFEDGQLGSIEDAVADGTVIYDGTKVQACMDAIEARPCSGQPQRTPPECEAVLAGTVDAGGACTLDAECIGTDLYCRMGASCPGTCTALETAGQPCRSDDQCQTGLKCEAGFCVRPAPAGQPCEGNVAPPCESWLLCMGDDAQLNQAGTCRNPVDVFVAGENDACNPDTGTLCTAGLHCALRGINGTTPDWRCVPTAAAGGNCNLAFFPMCPSGQFCDITLNDVRAGTFQSTCIPLPTAGQPCAAEAGGRACATGDVCVSGTCRALERLGGACTSPDVCYSGRCSSGQCVVANACP
jgi:hypothetical protein